MELPNDQLFEIEVLVFSSQKTATQTILRSLNESGVNCLHGHTTENVGLPELLFREYLRRYIEINKRPLKIVSVFRDPLERMVSSFFQSLSEDKFAYTHPNREFPIHDATESLLYRLAPAAIRELFYHYCDKIDGWGESIATICKILDLEIETLQFSEINKIGINRLKLCDVYLLRFDFRLPYLDKLLSQITGQDIILRSENLANTKYYFDQYRKFGEAMELRVDLIEQMYQSRKALMDLFYPGQFNAILNARIRRYGR